VKNKTIYYNDSTVYARDPLFGIGPEDKEERKGGQPEREKERERERERETNL